MVGLLVEEARDALPLPNHPQCERDARLVISTSPHAPIPRSGFVLRPQSRHGHSCSISRGHMSVGLLA